MYFLSCASLIAALGLLLVTATACIAFPTGQKGALSA